MRFPDAIPWLIVAVVVDAFDSQPVRRPHVAIEGIEFEPCFANAYSASAIELPVFATRICTAAYHVMPNLIFAATGLRVRYRSKLPPTTTGNRFSSAQTPANAYRFRPAFTAAKKLLWRSPSLLREDSQPPKYSVQHWYCFHSFLLGLLCGGLGRAQFARMRQLLPAIRASRMSWLSCMKGAAQVANPLASRATIRARGNPCC